ncbi:MAG TPA: glycosyl hydrolase family 28-related protein [Phycisphaerae bacterium]|nr:glycosyl hydrolase family 28-related protein [Phycisphaerae bacterium]HON65335.1 glycosyl hydrolase family 28-related protein [Phycisphaerae bacterium]HOQ84732.1 glycosyl hydrolase family 28-related protein [Phycisphaerae bacterium]HPP26448.1 glycosyl hydrolase family 28-related protein [Phycisphaerae bacterium]HPZ98916.1 glycosyl hydrolase family 28-related protein [Phycisphaerae bacterium]
MTTPKAILCSLVVLFVGNVCLATDLARFGIRGDGIHDDSAAIQQALDEAARTGGTVQLGVGRYRLDKPIRVPQGVTLAGVWEAPHHAEIGTGTIIEAYAGKGSESGPALITLTQSSAVKGLTFFYPEQKLPEPFAYPWTIQGTGMHGSVIDCTFVNSYQAIFFGPENNELHYIRNCFGCPLKAGVRVDNCTDIGRIENVHFNPHYWARTNAPNRPKWPDLSKYLWENFVAFEFGRTDWEYVHNTFCYGAKVGYKFVKTPKGTVNGNFLGIGADWCERAILVEHSQPPGLLITNGEFVGGKGAAAMMEVAASHNGAVQLSNCSFWGPADAIAIVAGKGMTSFNQCLFRNHGDNFKNVYTIDARSGDLMVTGCRFGMDSPDIRIGPDVDTAVITGNWFFRSQEIVNESNGVVQMGFNVTGNRPTKTTATRPE